MARPYSLIDQVDQAIERYVNRTGQSPKIVYLHPKTLAELHMEMRPLAAYGPIPGMSTCPHCKESLIQFRGIQVDTLKEGDVIVG